jgi:hypothetical protein
VLPEAERVLRDELHILGGRMLARRLELALPRTGEIAYDTLRALPTGLFLMSSGALLAGSYVLRHALKA